MTKTLLLFLVSLFSVFACAEIQTGSITPDTGNPTLVYCSEDNPEGFDPASHLGNTTFDASSKQIYNRLVEFKIGTTEIIPGLARSWEITNDGMTYIFHLRRGVKFHSTDFFRPSRDFNADDVLFSFVRQMDKNHPFYKVNYGSYEWFNSTRMSEMIKEVKKQDLYTVEILLTRPDASIIATFAMDFFSILSKEYADSLMDLGNKRGLDKNPIGTGPFQFISYKKNTSIRYKAHPEYWDGAAAITDLIFDITPDMKTRYKKLRSGKCHLMSYPAPSDLKSMQKNTAINVLKQVSLNVGYLAWNTRIAPFDNPKVRKALNKAINKEAIVKAVWQGHGMVAKNPIPPTIWAYNNSIQDDSYDPSSAKAILEAEGVNDLSMKIWEMPVQRPYAPRPKRIAEMVRSDLAKVGVKANIVSYEWSEYLARSRKLDRDGAVLLGWTGDNGDPHNFLGVLLSCDSVGGGNRAQWCYKPFDEIIEQAIHTTDTAKRTQLYRKAQEIFKDQAPWLTLAHSVTYWPVRKEVIGFKPDPFGGHYFYGVNLE